MSVKNEIESYLTSLSPLKSQELRLLHQQIATQNSTSQLWYFDGKDASGKQVSNPNIGYGFHEIQYANGKSREFYRIGISANTTGISVYIMGLENKNYLKENYAEKIGKAKITGYCIHFKCLADIELNILLEIINKHLQ